MDNQNCSKPWKWQVIFCLFLYSWGWVSGQLRYSIVEESEPGTLIGNVAKELKMNAAEISKRRIKLGSEEVRKYFALNHENGDLIVNEKIDRESLCGSISACLLSLEIVMEQPLELFSLEIEIIDINDNSPRFSKGNHIIRISEALANPGTHFPLESAQDLDIGSNGVSQYKLEANSYFTLSVKTRKDGTLIPELFIEKALDREEKRDHRLIITALDGGKPVRSGTSQITVIVLDSNDNAPVFDHLTYKVSLMENTPPTTVVLRLNATDVDEGLNGEVEYFFDYHTLDSIKQLFSINQQTGEISVKGIIDYEETQFYETSIIAKDKGAPEMQSRCILLIDIEDINDNAPEITLTSMLSAIPENAAMGTAIGFLSLKDKDAGRNGEVHLELSPNIPFKVKAFNNRYSIVTDGLLDREKNSQFTLNLVATDLGSPPLSTQTSIILNISDINDNAPTFNQPFFNTFIKENNDPGTLLCTVSAFDPDDGLNSQLFFSIIENQIEGSPVSSLVYINSNTGNIYSQRSFDYEQVQVLQITVKVEDSGSPKLSSSVTVFIFILDENDNAPSILYPEYTKEFTPSQKISKVASAGTLVTKVSAVDPDSGQNAWLIYNIEEATDLSLFQISSHSGEIRTLRGFLENDSFEQRLSITVKDHGEPSLTTTIIIMVTLEDNNIQEGPKSPTFLINSQNKPDVTLYLIISLVAISLVSLVTFIILLARCLRDKSDNSFTGCLGKTQPIYYTEQYKPTLHLNTWYPEVHGG
ncbi:LOW QUALITY PROTEIN: protocadherin gamma-C5-like [Bombina bombina]|uniref:LOW QUALITY PROTEIN: protocadherin gamma-C5-like n=1 Tax=Bombina bombina TaxID=8345 RepID=UPI00235ABEA5|nr:LOW QUALITY PROTEIN: protocadherin gamma-C5-like [Bombina bombina]